MESSESKFVIQDIDTNIIQSDTNVITDQIPESTTEPFTVSKSEQNTESTTEPTLHSAKIIPECLRELMSNEYQRV